MLVLMVPAHSCQTSADVSLPGPQMSLYAAPRVDTVVTFDPRFPGGSVSAVLSAMAVGSR